MISNQNNPQVFLLDCKNIGKNKTGNFQSDSRSFRLYHNPDEPPLANRLWLKIGELEAEILPSKGLSLGQVTYKGNKYLWEAPYMLPDPETLDLWSDEVCINGKPAKGFTYLKTFAAGIEFYGLKNWGMPREDKVTGEFFPLHGETSNIPVEELKVETGEDYMIVSASYIYRDMKESEPQPWYLNGPKLFKVSKYFLFQINPEPSIIIKDTIENISEKDLIPDWGYHITFYPVQGTQLLLGSGEVEERSGGELPPDIESWDTAENSVIRQETGIIHKNLIREHNNKEERTSILVRYPSGEGIIFRFPLAPYFQTWSCKGGAGSDEFSFKTGETLMKENWDGLGIEIGSSALDHNGNTDQTVNFNPVLAPGEEKVIEMEMRIAGMEKVQKLADEINQFNQARKLKGIKD